MPITGLPDPTLHRKCKRCGIWIHLHEGSLTWPPKRGLLSFVHVTLAESIEQTTELKFYCVPCQERNARDERGFRKLFVTMGVTVLGLAVALLIASWLGLFTHLESFLRGR